MQNYEVRTMPDGIYVVVADGKPVTTHSSFIDAQRVSDHMNRVEEHKQKEGLLYTTEMKSE